MGIISQKSLFAYMLAISLIVLASYWGAIPNGFHFDDYPNFVDVQDMHLSSLDWDQFKMGLEAARIPERVLPNATFIIDWWRGGGNSKAFQQTNILIHILNSILLFLFIIKILTLKQQPGSSTEKQALAYLAFAFSLLWALHPIQLQGVTYVVQRMASMVSLFMLLSTLSYVYARTTTAWHNRFIWLVTSLFFGFLAFHTKENSWILPLLLLAAEYGVVRHSKQLFRWWFDRYIWLFSGLTFLYIILDIFIINGPLSVRFGSSGYINRDFNMNERLLTQARVIWFHLSQLAFPLPSRFSLEHNFPVSSNLTTPLTTLPAVLGIAAWSLAGFTLLLRKQLRLYGFLLLAPLILLIPESTVVALEIIFEHRFYLPSMIIFTLCAVIAWQLVLQHNLRILLLVILSLPVGAVLAYATIQRIPDWRTPISLGQANVKAASDSARAWFNLGHAYREAGIRESALENYATAYKLATNDREVLERLAQEYANYSYYGNALKIVVRINQINVRAPLPRHLIWQKEWADSCDNHLLAAQATEALKNKYPWINTDQITLTTPPKDTALVCETTLLDK